MKYMLDLIIGVLDMIQSMNRAIYDIISTFFFAYKPVHKHELVRWSASMAQKQTIIDETKVLNPKAEIQLLYKRYEHTSNLSLN